MYFLIISDYVQTISIVDPSLSDPEDRIVCLLFTPRIDSLPKFKGIGQIIRLHRLKVNCIIVRLQMRARNVYFTSVVVYIHVSP